MTEYICGMSPGVFGAWIVGIITIILALIFFALLYYLLGECVGYS